MFPTICLQNWTSLFLVSVLYPLGLVTGASPKHYHIGAVLSSSDQTTHFYKIIEDINYDDSILPPGVTLHGHTILKRADPIENTRNFCHNLMSNEISTVIIDDLVPSEAITFTSSLHSIPTIGLTNRESIFSDKSLYGSYMRTSSSYAHQADVWIELLRFFEYECAHFLVSDSVNGRNIRTRFLALADVYNLEIETLIEYDHRKPYLTAELEAIYVRNSSCRVYLLYADQENAFRVLDQINAVNRSREDQVWIASEQSLTMPNLPIGFLGARYKNWNNVNDHVIDSVYVIANAIKSMYKQVNFTTPPSDCKNIGRPKWLEGEIFYDYLREQTIIYGRTGKISFDERGDRLNGDYEILNQQSDGKDRTNRHATVLVNVGRYFHNQTAMKMQMDIHQQSIVWPGNRTQKPVGYALPNHLRIATLAEAPFVSVVPPDRRGKCGLNQIPCPITRKLANDGESRQNYCCEGYCMDLLTALANQLNFTYSLYQVPDGLYGSFAFDPKSGQHEWTGLLGELYYGRADMVVAALTITPERSMAIDFTKPFKYQGITILQKRQAINRLGHPLTSFLQPFHSHLWVSVFVSVHVVALALYLLDRFSPFGRYKLPNCETITEEDALNLSSAIWFAWGVLFNSGIGEGTPRSFSGRVLGMIWAGFAMIVVASYTANLAAFLVLDRPQTELTGINDPRLRSPLENFNFSTVRDSSVDLYFRRQVELAAVNRRMADIYFENAEDAIAAVKSGSLGAFIWDSARLEYEAAKDCDLLISGEHFGRSGYAIGLPKAQSYWKEKVTVALLSMHEFGIMEDLDNKWILLDEQLCDIKTEQFPPTLGLANMAGVFILVGTGILGGVGLIMFEIFYKQHQTRKQKRMELARNAVDKWKEMVENRKIVHESMSMAARQRYKERHQVHRRRQQLRNSSKSLSDERSISVSSSTGTTAGIQFENCNNLSTTNSSGKSDRAQQCGPTVSPPPAPLVATIHKPTFLELKHAHTSASGPSTSHRRFEQEQHPRANTRIHKPKLRREFSVAYEGESSYEPPPTLGRPSSHSFGFEGRRSVHTVPKHGNLVNIV